MMQTVPKSSEVMFGLTEKIDGAMRAERNEGVDNNRDDERPRRFWRRGVERRLY